MTRLYIATAVALASGITTFAAPLPAGAEAGLTIHRFTPAAFKAAQAAGKPILVEVHAPWCPVCRAQQPAIATAVKDPKNRGLMVFRVDYDTMKAAQKPLGVRTQSTLIAFRGFRETGRLAGETNTGKIAALIATTRG